MPPISDRGGIGLRRMLFWARGDRRRFLAAASCALLGAACGLIQPIIVTRTVERAAAHATIVLPLALLTALFLLQAALKAYSTYTLDQAGESIVLRLRGRLIDHLLRLHISVFGEQRVGDLISRATTDTTLLRDAIAYQAVGAVVNCVVVVGGVTMMVVLDPLLAAVVLVVVVTSMSVVGSVLPRIRHCVEAAQDAIGHLASELERVLSGIRTVRIHNREPRESESLRRTAQRIYDHNLRAARVGAVVSPALDLGARGSFILVIIVGLARVSSGAMTIGDLVAFLLYVGYVSGPASGLLDIARAVQTGLAALRRVEGILVLPAERDGEREDSPETGRNGLVVQDIRFRYGDRTILEDVSIRLPHNSYTALVGPSGAGKSTMVDLLTRFREPEAGEILLDGRSAARGYTLAQWRAKVGLVDQGNSLMYGTLRENITYGVDTVDETALHQVIDITGLTSMLDRLPDGLDTQLGEHGAALSGGEQQRVAIARALLTRPEILILDEPTSHLDAANEALLVRTLRRISAHCIVLVIAHRPATVRHADRVAVLDESRIAALGDYEEVRHLLGPNTSPLPNGRRERSRAEIR
ncbi:ABC transporter ATP-binding protein [Nocardia huaxiensis]|uniref:ABC transporter ATP-binding protein n=1 Tax=Nocardia huaxiensis TaxID=2755382 RepID=A0A7D6V5Z5_9NOCA|nr:ABC transporter ATP-binding protein [Nocardia huaxiensis]QLY28292.1 ABC transporter ATP-binding protein [Nocardia huaxiensis]